MCCVLTDLLHADYAVDIFHHAVDNPENPYACYLRADSTLPMMMLSDCLNVCVL